MRSIDADAVIKEINEYKAMQMPSDKNSNLRLGMVFSIAAIQRTPTIDPVVHGEWVEGEDDGLNTCSACKEYSEYATRFCCNCGAKMDGGK